MSYFVYLARCKNESLYVGSCANLEKREIVHNKGKGSQFTKQRRPVKIIYQEKFDDMTDARRREKQIKGWTRIKKENLIKYRQPRI